MFYVTNALMDLITSFSLVSVATALLLFVIFFYGAKSITNLILKIVPKFFRKKSTEFQNAFVESFRKPILYSLKAFGIYLLLAIFPLPSAISQIISILAGDFIDIVSVLLICVSLLNLINYYNIFFPNLAKALEDKSKTLSRFFINIVKALVIALTVVMILDQLNFDVAGLITGLGLTGLTFALAAQDTASNFFSGVMILMDKPFKIGDWISTGSIEGVVEEINFRSSRVRTFDNALITVPNNKLSNDSITNWTLMNLRRTKISIGLIYSTSKETMQTVIDKINEELKLIPEIKSDTIIVRFDNYSASSLDILVQYHSFPIALPEHLLLKEKVQYIIMDIVEKENTDFAFQTFTVYNEK